MLGGEQPEAPVKTGKLGIRKLAGLHYYVRDLERSRRLYVECMGFAEVGRSSPELERAGRQRSLVFQGGDVTVACSTPVGKGVRAWRYLSRHPDSVGALPFQVEDIRRTFAKPDESGGAPRCAAKSAGPARHACRSRHCRSTGSRKTLAALARGKWHTPRGISFTPCASCARAESRRCRRRARTTSACRSACSNSESTAS